jgi:magnesium transporter
MTEDRRTATVIGYNQTDYQETPGVALEDVDSMVVPGKIVWVRIEGEVSEAALRHIGPWAHLDRIDQNTILEHLGGNPRLIQFGNQVFLSWKYVERADKRIEERAVHLLAGEGFVISFEQHPHDFDRVKNLLIKETKIRKMPASFLLYSILETTMDDFFEYTKYLGKRIDELQEEIIEKSSQVVDEVLELRDELDSLWLSVWHLKDVAHALYERRSGMIDDSVMHDYEDLNNGITRLTQMLESTRQVVPQVISLYQNDLANELNKIVRILTVITVIFTPLMLIPTWYGMNFEYMPEFGNLYGYVAVTLVTLAIGLLLTLYFWRKKWFSF